ncbi:Ail/Lom family outer membrane beta-barrel protein, partial [Escherichia coli]|nr:Ail/Lom family outer membrane beta-barrel protein [Escherichia coli]
MRKLYAAILSAAICLTVSGAHAGAGDVIQLCRR